MRQNKPTESMLRALTQISEAQSAVVINKGSITQVLASGEIVKAMPDTFLRLLVGGWLTTYGDGRLTPTMSGIGAAEEFRSKHPAEYADDEA